MTTRGCHGIAILGADRAAIATGAQNTLDIQNSCGDWYLPSKDELNKLFINLSYQVALYESTDYWSSTEIDSGNAWIQSFNSGLPAVNNFKYGGSGVRAVRAF